MSQLTLTNILKTKKSPNNPMFKISNAEINRRLMGLVDYLVKIGVYTCRSECIRQACANFIKDDISMRPAKASCIHFPESNVIAFPAEDGTWKTYTLKGAAQ